MMRVVLLVLVLLFVSSANARRGLNQAPPPTPTPPPPPPLPAPCPTGLPFTDADILNFALNLECLEAEFYSYAAFGHGLSPDLLGGGPGSFGGMKANLSSTAAAAAEFATDEANHVKFLRQALGDAAVPCPRIDLGPAFVIAADLAFSKILEPPFSPYANDINFVAAAYLFEDVGVTAYNGAAPYIADKTYLSAGASILAVEAYHAGWARTEIAAQLNTPTPYGVTVGQISNSLADLVNILARTNKAVGVLGPNGNPVIVPADANSLAFARLPPEILNIVRLFFPDNLNGYFKV